LQRKLLRIEQELQYRRKINPLQFFQNLPQQLKFALDMARVKALFGGNRSGKTEKGAEYVISKCLAKPNQRWWASAETFPDSVNIQQRKIWSLIPKTEIKYGFYNEITGFPNRKILFKNGSIVILKSYDQGVESYASDDVDGIWFDEEPPMEIYKESRMRLLDRNGEIIFTMTSTKGITDLISDIFEDYDIISSEYAPYVNETLPRVAEKNGIRFYFLWTTENPYIDQKTVLEEIHLQTTQEKKSRMYGLPINLSGKIYITFNKKIHVIPFEQSPLSDLTLYFTLDPHDRKPWVMQWYAVHSTGAVYCIDEYPNRNFNEMLSDDKTYDEYADIIREKEAILQDIYGIKVTTRILDPNFGNKTVQLASRVDNKAHTTPKEELKKRGFVFKDGIDNLEAGHLKVREFLDWKEKDGEITKQPAFFITDNNENTIRHFSRYSRKDIMTPSGDMKDNAGVQEKYKDFCDGPRYLLMSNPKHIISKQKFSPEHRKVY